MSEDEFKRMFRTVAAPLESLAISIQNVEDLQETDRVRLGDRERKELRERINALIDAQLRSEAVFAQFQVQMAEMQKKADERTMRMEETHAQFHEQNAQFQAQVGVALTKLADAMAFAHQRLDTVELKG